MAGSESPDTPPVTRKWLPPGRPGWLQTSGALYRWYKPVDRGRARSTIECEEAPMRFTISIPQFVADSGFDSAALRTYLARAEALGFDSAWTMGKSWGPYPPWVRSS
jgi:hypothetical protein